MPKKPPMIDAALRKAIRDSGCSNYLIGQEAGVSHSAIDRFMYPIGHAGRRGITLETAAKIAAVLGLVLVLNPDLE